MRGLAELAEAYDVILCDVWGVLHNGSRSFRKALDALARFRGKGGRVILITNSPKPSRRVQAQLERLGASTKAYDAIVSSGDVTVSLLLERQESPLFHLGPAEEQALFEEVLALTGKPPRLVGLGEADFALCTGLADPFKEKLSDYDARLARMRARDLDLICANPDILVEDGGSIFYCAGAIAERYAAAGGRVIHAGKPFAPIYARALELANQLTGRPIDRSRVLVIGDAMRTDIKGACDQGLASLLVTSGIHRKELVGVPEESEKGEGADIEKGLEKESRLDVAALRRLTETAGYRPNMAIAELIW